ncbi:MAG: heavy metal-associated domain-containing protein [Patescibacteria group bacterium]|nr:heavy metal-associated domain-containing protein [Patescibacteria group bacterium]
MITSKFKVSGFDCESCIKLTKLSLQDLPGVKEVRIKDLKGETEIDADRQIGLDEVQKALADTHYTASLEV